MNKRTLIVLTIFFSINSCKPDYPPEILKALEQAGANKGELEKVLVHYKQNSSDSLKLKAAYFLIQNTIYHYSVVSEQLDKFDKAFFDSIVSIEKVDYNYDDYEIIEKIIQTPIINLWNRNIERYGDPSTFKISVEPDCKAITAELLIENIDCAFKAWQFPWARHINFEQFCEYLLPYRFEDEPLESWRPFFMDRYKWLSDSLKDKSDPIEACTLINNDIASWLLPRGGGIYKKHPRGFTPSQLFSCRISFCLQQAAAASFAMRAMGLAVARNKIPNWGDRSMGHDFNSVLSKENKFIDFLGGDLPPGKNVFKNKAPKIYRETFSMRQPDSEKKLINSPLNIDLSKNIDITDEFISTIDLSINLDYNKNLNRIAYLCIFNNKDWIPVESGKVNNGKATFRKMGTEIVYLPVYIEKGEQIPAGLPFFLDENGTISKFIPEIQSAHTVHLFRKYPLAKRFIEYDKHMIGGKFQGANQPDFSDAVDLHIITTVPDTYFKSYLVPEGNYRYLRYLFPPVSLENAKGNVAEIGFKSIDENGNDFFLDGKYIFSPEITQNNVKILFDNDLDNYITINISNDKLEGLPDEMIVIKQKKELWIGLDLGKSQKVTHVNFCPRNDTNNLYTSCDYELFYWENKWISLGKNQVKDDRLIYDNVPIGALLLLHNHSGGKEERIFTYENGIQVWW